VRLWARSGTDYTTCLDRFTAAVAALPVGAAQSDGEAIAFDPEGHPSFGALRSREGQAGAALIAYDLLDCDGVDTRRSRYRTEETAGKAPIEAEGRGGTDLVSGVVLSEAIEK
jgi:ATP-dependent DNA ligase